MLVACTCISTWTAVAGVERAVASCTPVGAVWETFDASNSGLPGDYVNVIAFGSDGSEWFGTYFGNGVGRLLNGQWDVFNGSNTPMQGSDRIPGSDH